MSIKIGNNNKIDNSNISDSFYREEDKWDYIGYGTDKIEHQMDVIKENDKK